MAFLGPTNVGNTNKARLLAINEELKGFINRYLHPLIIDGEGDLVCGRQI